MGSWNEYWREVSKMKDLSEDFIKINKHHLFFPEICRNYPNLSLPTIHILRKYIDWENLIIYHEIIDLDFISEHNDLIPWDKISKNRALTYDKIEHYKLFLNWDILSEYRSFGPNKIELFYDRLNLALICKHQRLSMTFLENHWCDLYKYNDIICQYQKLTVSFMRKYADKLDWAYICEYQKLSSAFMNEVCEKHFDWYCWAIVSEYQKMTESFITKHRDNLLLTVILRRDDITLSENFKSSPEMKFYEFIIQRKADGKKWLLRHGTSTH